MLSRRPALVALTSILMSGCSLGAVGEAERTVASKATDVTRHLHEARQPMTPAKVSPVKVEGGIYSTSIARRAENGDQLPRKVEVPGVTIVRATPMELFDIGTAITEATGIPVSFAADAIPAEQPGQKEAPPQSQSGADSTLGAKPVGTGGVDLGQLLGNMGLSSGGNAAGAQGNQLKAVTSSRGAMKVNFTGKLSHFLNQVGSHFGVTWEYKNGQIHIFRNVTRTFTVQALPSTVEVQSMLDAGNKSEGESGDSAGSNQRANSSVSVKIWEEISNAVSSMVGENGRVSTSVSTGTITVTAPGDVVRRVQEYVDGQNARMTKQVAVSVEVLNVSVVDGDDFKLDLQALFSGSAKYGFSLGNSAAATALTQGVPGLNFGIISPTSSWTGSNGVISALSEKGRVSVVSTASVTTLNGIPAPLQVSNTRNFLERVEVTTSDTGNTTSLTPGSVTTGFNLSLLPRVMDDGSQLLMQFGINISELVGKKDGFDEFTAAGMTIQLPNKNSRSFVQQTMIPNGHTLVLTGFEQVRNAANKQGMGHADMMLLGGGQNGRNQRDVIVVLLTPVLLDAKAPLIQSN